MGFCLYCARALWNRIAPLAPDHDDLDRIDPKSRNVIDSKGLGSWARPIDAADQPRLFPDLYAAIVRRPDQSSRGDLARAFIVADDDRVASRDGVAIIVDVQQIGSHASPEV
jgi:hypothetical protein